MHWRKGLFVSIVACALPTVHVDGKDQVINVGNRSFVHAVAFSPDGNRIFTGHGDVEPSLFAHGEVRIWDVESGKELAALKGHGSPVNAIAVSSDGKSLVAGGGK